MLNNLFFTIILFSYTLHAEYQIKHPAIEKKIISQNLNLIRKLQENQEDQITEICLETDLTYKPPDNFETINDYLENISINIDDKNNFINNTKYNSKSKDAELYEQLISHDLENEISFKKSLIFNSVKKYFFNYISKFLLVLWILLLFCFFTGTCLFNDKTEYGSFAKFSSYFSFFSFISIFILGLISLNFINPLYYSFNGSSCNLIKFFYTVKNGHHKTDNLNAFRNDDIWPGLLNTETMLIESMSTIKEIIKYEDYFRNQEINLANMLKDYYNNLDIFFGNIKSSSFYKKYKLKLDTQENNNNSNNNNTKNKGHNNQMNLLPIYIKEYINNGDPKSLINKLSKEYQDKFINSEHLLKNISNHFQHLCDNNQTIDKTFKLIFDKIDYTRGNVKAKAGKFIKNIQYLTYEYTSFFFKFIKIMQYIYLSISVLVVLCLFVYILIKSNTTKFLLHILWNLSIFTLILSLGISFILLKFSIFSKDIIYFLEKRILDTKNNTFFNTCLNSDGDLSKYLQLDDNSEFIAQIIIDDFISENSKVIDFLKPLQVSNDIKETITKNNKYLEDFSLATYLVDFEKKKDYVQQDTVNEMLKNISYFTNKNFNHSEACTSEDIWVSIKSKCLKNYIYVPKVELKDLSEDKLNMKKCLLVQDNYEDHDILKLYNKKCNKKALSEILFLHKNIHNFYLENKKLLTKLNDLLFQMDENNKKLIDLFNKEIKDMRKIIKTFLDVYRPIILGGSFRDFFNCNGIKKFLFSFYDISFNYLRFYCKIIGYIFLIISLFFFIGIFFLICAILRNSSKATRKYLKKLNQEIEANQGDVELIEEVSNEDDNENEGSENSSKS